MQGKGVIKFFLWVLAIVCFIQYMYWLPTRKIEKAADRHGQEVAAKISNPDEAQAAARTARTEYLDSMSDESVLSIPYIADYTYQDLKSRQLALGLDLKGGLSEVLQVNLKEFIRTLSKDSKDPTFINALDKAESELSSAQSDFVTLFGNAWAENSDGKSMAQIFARNPVLQEEVKFNTSDEEVLRVLREKADETVDLTFKRLKDRIDRLGVTQPNVTLDKARDLIFVELPGVDNPERAKNYLQASAKLEFWEVFRLNQNIFNTFYSIDKKLKNSEGDTTSVVDETQVKTIERYEPQYDDFGNIVDSILVIDTIGAEEDPFANAGPLLSKLTINGQGGQLQYPLYVVGIADKNKRDAINEILQRKEFKSMFPKDIKFLWDYKPFTNYSTGEKTNQYLLNAIRIPRGGGKAPLEGDHVVRATSQPDPTTGKVAVTLYMDQEGARIWGKMTSEAFADNSRSIAIVLDDGVVSAPSVNGPITGGVSEISGNFSIQEGQDLANILEIGKLPAQTEIIQESIVGPSLGAENIRSSFISLVIGFLLVLVFMVLYYAVGGFISILCLFANLFFIFGTLSSFGTVLTLPGIAGIVLTIGMAVDANVIIFERIREELRSGKGMKQAISEGFQASYSAIIDANVTTFLTAAILAYFGLGPIKGFAVVLMVGVVSSILTAVLMGRLLIDYWMEKGWKMSFWNDWSKNVLANVNIDWIGRRKTTYTISAVAIILSLAAIFVRGFDLGVDFKGGYSYTVEFDPSVEVGADDIRSQLSQVLTSAPVVKAVSTQNVYNIVTDENITDNTTTGQDKVTHLIFDGLKNISGVTESYDQFSNASHVGTHINAISKVGPTIADDIKKSSLEAGIFALLMIFFYIFIRFNKWQYSLGAVAALFHDTIIVLGIFAAFWGIFPFSMEIDQAFIAAILTVIGYSINDTVIVFDRIREYLGIYVNKSKTDVFNLAINSTLSRTLITSMTTLFVVFVLFAFGGSSIKGFAFAILIGILVGTYSSIFIASPIVHDLSEDDMHAKKKKK